ncbi:MAG: sulfite exporter TauE/SafE family protein [Parachlamydiaceae bacterium]|nr:sulfite exporter TauE/SafE family protein [Parachlamydiaceae bacterium]
MEDFLIFFTIGFIAQIIDGALGMAYGLTTTTFLLNFGVPPISATAITHAAECITTGFSAIAHHRLGNVNKTFFFRLLFPGVIGAILGVLLITNIDADIIKPFMAIYLLVMGIVIISKAFTVFPPVTVTHHLAPLGFIGGFMDAVGGGGWGPIITSTLLARGQNARMTIGSVNASEFFISVTVTIAFFFSHTFIGWPIVAALAAGGAVAAPIGAWLCKHIPVKVLLFVVGLLIIGLSTRMLWLSLHPH